MALNNDCKCGSIYCICGHLIDTKNYILDGIFQAEINMIKENLKINDRIKIEPIKLSVKGIISDAWNELEKNNYDQLLLLLPRSIE